MPKENAAATKLSVGDKQIEEKLGQMNLAGSTSGIVQQG